MSTIKQDRVGGRIRRILSELLVREVGDPRLHGVTITRVELDPELMFAKVFVNALGEEERAPEVMEGLKHAKRFLRREVAQRVHLRSAPDLIFRWDATLEQGERINQLLNSLAIPPAPVEPEAAAASEPAPADDEWIDDDAERDAEADADSDADDEWADDDFDPPAKGGA